MQLQISLFKSVLGQSWGCCLSMMERKRIAHPKMFSGRVIQAQGTPFNHCASTLSASY